MHALVRLCICYVILAIIEICLNTIVFPSLCIYLTLDYHTFNLSFIHLHVTQVVCFKANFLLMTIKYYFILFYSDLNSAIPDLCIRTQNLCSLLFRTTLDWST